LFSQTLTLDTAFGTNGRTLTSFGVNDSNLPSLTPQPDGRIIACGSYYVGNINQMIVSRYNSNGTIDTSFGTNGKVVAPVGTPLDNEYNSVDVLTSGKIVIAGTNYDTI